MFTDRFIKVPISIFNVKEKEITGKENLEDSWFKFLPFELAGYRPTYFDDDSNRQDSTTIILKSGDTTTANITTDEFEKLLNDHQK
jgi:hypothetical protein